LSETDTCGKYLKTTGKRLKEAGGLSGMVIESRQKRQEPQAA